MKLDYKILDTDYYDEDGYSVCIEVDNKEYPSDEFVYIDLRYDIDNTNLQVDIFKGEPTYVDYGSQSVLYDDGISVEGVDASHGVVDFYDFFVCDDYFDPIHKEEKFDKQTYDKVMSETAKSLGMSVEEFQDSVYDIGEEVRKVVIKDLEKYYEDNPDHIPDSVLNPDDEYDGPDYDDWRDLDWE